MSKEPQSRKSITLPVILWEAIDEIRRQTPGRVPSQRETVQQLLQIAVSASLYRVTPAMNKVLERDKS